MKTAAHFDVHRDTFGRWRLTFDDGSVVENVSVVRAFPITQPERGFSIVDAQGHERVWIEQLTDLPDPLAQTLMEALANREFMPEIRSIRAVSTFATPSTWDVLTDRGETKLVLKGEEDIRRLALHAFVIADKHGIHYLIRDITALDKASRRLLDRFL
jgi:hypothetical protein